MVYWVIKCDDKGYDLEGQQVTITSVRGVLTAEQQYRVLVVWIRNGPKAGISV
jgi:hypothetical protein